MAEAAKAQEPSMEEILASIRRIIAEDDGSKEPSASAGEASPPSAAQAESPAPEAGFAVEAQAPLAQVEEEGAPGPESQLESGGEPDDADSADVLELTPAMAVRKEEPRPAGEKPREEVPVFRVIDARPDLVFTDTPSPATTERQAAMSATAGAFFRDPGEASRPEPEAGRPLLSDHATAAVTSAFGSLAHTVLAQNARTLEDLVGEMLRPMLKAWLDDNLPTIVERLVRAEIERVSRGRT